MGVFLLLISLEQALRPAVRCEIEAKATSYGVEWIHGTVSEQLEEMNSAGQKWVSLQQDEQGNILAVTTAMESVNRLQSQVALSVQKALDAKIIQQTSMPLGSLTGWMLWSDRGPSVPVRIHLLGQLQTQIESQFEEAGINQTRHRILLKVAVDIKASIPWYGMTTRVETECLISETVLIGQVPDSYTHVVAGDSSLTEEVIFGNN